VFNVSAIPDGYFTQYQTDRSNSTQSSSQNSTSWSAGAAESVSTKLVIGDPDASNVTVKDKFSAQQHRYYVTPYIFGQTRPGGVVSDIKLTGDVQTFGMLRTVFVVGPTRNDAGGWWRQVYNQAPDVALNHPTRWNVSLSDQSNPNNGTCLL